MSVTLQPAELDAETAFDIAAQVLAGGGRVEGATVTLWAATAVAPVQLGRRRPVLMAASRSARPPLRRKTRACI